jgi:AcrR family transcriptional regulator
MNPARPYRMTARAELVEQTRRRIIEAAVELHGSIGPAKTTVAAVAERAGVTRLTVYRHFPNDDAMFGACTAHWASQQNMPDLEAWLTESDPVERLGVALTDLFRFYAEAEPMLTLSGRDRDALPAFVQMANDARVAARVETVLSAWPKRQHTSARRALVSHALAFTTWRSLCLENGLSTRQAVDAVVRMVAGKTVGARG